MAPEYSGWYAQHPGPGHKFKRQGPIGWVFFFTFFPWNSLFVCADSTCYMYVENIPSEIQNAISFIWYLRFHWMGKWRQARSLKSAKASQSFKASQSAKGAGGRSRTRPEGRNRTRNVRSPFRTGGRNRTRTCQKPDRRGILERVETEREGVKTERGVHFMWQAQHCGSVTCNDMVRYDISCIRDRHAIVDRVEAERGGRDPFLVAAAALWPCPLVFSWETVRHTLEALPPPLLLINIHPLLPPPPTAEKSLCFLV